VRLADGEGEGDAEAASFGGGCCSADERQVQVADLARFRQRPVADIISAQHHSGQFPEPLVARSELLPAAKPTPVSVEPTAKIVTMGRTTRV
jgi:hypothetical protein